MILDDDNISDIAKISSQFFVIITSYCLPSYTRASTHLSQDLILSFKFFQFLYLSSWSFLTHLHVHKYMHGYKVFVILYFYYFFWPWLRVFFVLHSGFLSDYGHIFCFLSHFSALFCSCHEIKIKLSRHVFKKNVIDASCILHIIS